MDNILNEVLKLLPETADITDSGFEGANIVLYTKNAEFFLDNQGAIKSIVDSIKKRVELRPDPSLQLEQEKAEKKISEIIPKEAGVIQILFDPARSIVVVEVEKPGIAIGKNGELLKEIRRQTLWVPLIQRSPPIKSTLIENVRQVLYENNDYRKKFLNQVGHRIYDGWRRGEKKNEWVRITTLGAGRQVGRSCFLLQTPESRILLDCGIDVAAQNSDAYPYLDAPEFDIEQIDAVVCTHPHIDHTGLIPFLYKLGYKGPTYMTAPARDTAALMNLDYISVAFKQAKKPLYSSNDIKEMVKHTICLEYDEVTDITPDIRLTLYNAGHTIGSALAHLHIGNGLHNFMYTGDFKLIKSRLLEGTHLKFPRLESLMMESTYGGKEDILPRRDECEEKMIKIFKETLEKGGKVLMPTLGVGRAQENMLILESAMREGRMPRAQVYLQGILWDVTAIHTAYPDFLNRNIRKAIFHKDENPFLSDIFKRIGSKKEQKDVLDNEGPCIILATSGMLTGGASVELFREMAENQKNTLMFTCYQGIGSLGRRVLDGEKEITMEGPNGLETVKVNMQIESISGLTNHAGRRELMNFLYKVEPRPRKVMIIHGESSKTLDLASSIHRSMKIETLAPKNLESIRLR